MRNNLPKKMYKNECGIINLDNVDGPGSHWTAYRRRQEPYCGKQDRALITYFDSFGNLKPPLEAIKYFNSNGYCKIIYNHFSYQSYNTVNCGHLCLEFLYNK